MATLAYPYSVRDSANTTTDNRKTGLTPTVANGKTLAAVPATVTASTAVSFVEIGAGDYIFLYDAEANGDASFPVDWGVALTNPNDRYATLILTRDAGRIVTNLDAQVSSRSTYAGGAVASVTAPVTVGTNNDKSGYALATPPPTAAQIAAAVMSDVTDTVGADVVAAAASAAQAAASAAQAAALGALFPAGFATLAIGAGGTVSFDGSRRPAVRNQDAVTEPTYDDCFLGAWCEAFGREPTFNSANWVKLLPDRTAAVRTFQLTTDAAGNVLARA